jgi:HK97 gp10 family phage protein
MAIQVKLQNAAELRAKLRGLPDRIAKNILKSAVRAMAAHLRDAVRAKAPVATGRLRRSIKSKDSGGRSKNREIAAKVVAGVGYARFIEQGTSQKAARPFMRPAFMQEKDALVKIFSDKIKDRLAEEAKK